MTSAARAPLLAITSLRFFAALVVVGSHEGFLAKSGSPALAWLYAHVFYEGYIGVTFFFILSGFILSYSYSERAESGRLQYPDFIFTRIARIVPLHLLTLLIALPLAFVTLAKGLIPPAHFSLGLLANAALLQAFVPTPDIYFSFNAPSWSLSVEMFFYALFPALLGLRTRWLAALAITILLAKCAVSAQGSEETVHFFVYIFPPARLIDFLAGILLFRLYRRWPEPSAAAATLAQALSVTTLAAFFCFKESISQALRYDTFYILPMAMLVLSFGWDVGRLAKAIAGRGLVFLGEASFALYLIHQLVIRYGESVRSRIMHGSSTTQDIATAVAYALISIGLSAVLFSRFEIGAKRWTLRTLQQCWGRPASAQLQDKPSA